MGPLNPRLYQILCQEFRHVRIKNEGTKLTPAYDIDLHGRTRMRVSSPGEYYVINCPYCSDQRFRLWINHLWGVRDARTGTRHRWLAHCFNAYCLGEEENRLDLIQRTSWYNREAGAGRITIVEGQAADPGRAIGLPRDYVRLDALARDHPARRYVRSRGFRSNVLARKWGAGFSPRRAFCLSEHGRLVIPIYRLEAGQPTCWGWQARAIVPEETPKYFTAPNLKKSHLLYGVERVDDGEGPVLICEGPLDVWRAGGNAVALLGKYASVEQIWLIQRHLRDRPLVVVLDGDAGEETHRLVEALRAARAGSLLRPDAAPVVPLRLAEGRDPGDTDRDDLWEQARRSLVATPTRR